MAFQFLPYGASAKIICTKSSKKGNLVTNYISSTNYTSSYQEIGLDGSYFLLSEKEPVEMTYNYTSNNGKLVEIITNFEVIADNINIKDNGNGHYSIINSDWINNGAGSFKISNETWFNNGRQEEPYIKLCFNKVQVECCFTNPWASASSHPNYSENGWKGLASNAPSTQLRPYSESAQNYCTLARYITVSWNTSEDNGNLFKGQYKDNTHWYQGWFSYGESDGTIRDFNYKISGKTDTAQRLWTTTGTNAFNLTVPPLNGSGNINGIVPYNYFKIGYTINFAGESNWQPASTLSINENNYIYDTEGFIYKQTINSNINSSNSSPVLYSHPSTNNWSNNSKFYKTSNGKYISPSDGIQITSTWDTGSYCIPYCDCQCDCNCDCQCDCEYGWCNSGCECQCNCNCFICDCQCNNCNCQSSGKCECQTGNCEGCNCNYSCDCQCDGGGTDNKPWETEKVYVGGSGYAWSSIWQYNEPNGSHDGSIPGGSTFSVYYSWNGWYQIAGNKWIRADADWDYSY